MYQFQNLNGGKSQSNQGTPDIPGSNIENDRDASRDGSNSVRNIVHRGIPNASGSVATHGPVISRQANPFAKGFSAFRTDSTLLSRPTSNQKEVEYTGRKATPSFNTETSKQQINGQGTASVKVDTKQVEQQVATDSSKSSTAPALEADISFGADDFLLGSDELALEDFMDDEVKGNEDSITLSWSPTPPKASQTRIQSPTLSQVSQDSTEVQILSNSRFSFTAATRNLNTSTVSISTTSKLQSSPSTSTSSKQPHTVINGAEEATMSSPISVLSSSSPKIMSSKVLVANSQDTSSSRPTLQDTVDRRSAMKNHKPGTIDVRGQGRHGLLRTQSSPSSGGQLTNHSTHSRKKLPGPAGNLPRLSAEEKEQLFRSRGIPLGKDTRFPTTGTSSSNSSIKKKMTAAHQGPIDSMFAAGAWEDMLKAYKLPDYKPSTLSRFKGSSPMIELSISDIELRPELHRNKISGLVVMIKEVSLSEIDAAVTLLDPSGEMKGTVHRTVLDQYKNNEIRVGTVLALKDVSVFSPSPISHYLIITPRNILGIFQPRASTIILSQGSSQDRLSQKRKLTPGDTQDPLPARQNERVSQSSSTSDMPIIIGERNEQPSSPEWHSSQHHAVTSTVTSANKSSASLEMLNMSLLESRSMETEYKKIKSAPPSQNTDPNLSKAGVHNTTQSLPDQQVYTKEVQFQSLRPAISYSNTATTQIKVKPSDFTSTPIITLGAKTPDMSGTNIPSLSSKSILSSFAASPNLRKRSSPSISSQRSNSSITSPGRAITQPSSSPAPPSTQRTLSSSDWPDEFRDDDLTGALGSDISCGSIDLHSPIQSSKGKSVDLSVTLLSPVSAPPLINYKDGDNDDYDDLDNLLDGLDESELFDL
ncbi:hypothetical protein BGZ46_009642 [Entomortierella lignicola]|nr:hypothetical protein BGZ46_009642 [Entomortierella lignicola]